MPSATGVLHPIGLDSRWLVNLILNLTLNFPKPHQLPQATVLDAKRHRRRVPHVRPQGRAGHRRCRAIWTPAILQDDGCISMDMGKSLSQPRMRACMHAGIATVTDESSPSAAK